MNLNMFDLNLLRVFEALMDERSVSAAAHRLALSQPAVSNSLRRLRELTGDPLFVRTRDGMHPTAKALLLGEPVQQGLATIRAGLARSTDFDPATSTRRFNLLMNDVGAASLLPRLLRELHLIAPNVDLAVTELDHTEYEAALDNGGADLAIGRLQLADSFRSEPILTSRYVALLRGGHPNLSDGRLTLAAYEKAAHVVVNPRGATPNPVARRVQQLGLNCRTALVVPHISALSPILSGTDLIATVPDQCVKLLCASGDLVSCELPFDVPITEVTQWWHRRHDVDPGHQWLRSLLRMRDA